ncbi:MULTISPECIES: hypothetical protein [unclassified Oceanispirochaeta]|uniref:hypothetical protein n=1 Tax=unclassified Oceanispirochaeta TaxID=2635722 RepID=UPI000E0918DF|nr:MULTISPECIES: hypothetical protein [unclassified Oceanispirochaeta]MBF9015736.1 hypothetical protein [Oceanispirochaeta sp. M2]NPD72201.1 hypothetical protein [Oceanispirochaeta sp. M1]RDG32300.1 hypothetical protein DV872_08830 [Oceanispirochaeta sp. M1]
MKYTKQFLFIIVLLSLSLTLQAQTTAEENKVFAPFVSQLKVETRGSAVLLTWKDSLNLNNPVYRIYESKKPFDPVRFIYDKMVAAVQKGTGSYLYSPGDSEPRYFLILAEEGGKIFDVFIPYRNMSMEPVAAEKTVVQEEKAARISSLTVYPESQDLLISAETTDHSRPHILFRSSKELINREDLSEATQVRVFVNEKIELKDHVVPGIPFYYALVDQALYESGSKIVLYDGSVTVYAVSIALEEWSPDAAHSFQFASRHVPLPLLNVNLDIETGLKLPNPGIPEITVDLTAETELALAGLNFGKSVHTPLWKQPELLPVDYSYQPPPETAWVKTLMDNGSWSTLLERCETQLKSSYDTEIRSRLFFYKGQANYFTGNLEYAFMDFLSSRSKYYNQSNNWLFSIYEQRKRAAVSENLE